jgi:hypothetical protein
MILNKCPIPGKNFFFLLFLKIKISNKFDLFSFSEDVGSINGTETVSLKSRNSHTTRSQSEI